MATMKVVQTPSAEVVEKANEIIYVTDGRGRRFGLKRPGVLSQFRLVDLLGPETAKNEVYMAMVMPVTWVCSIEAGEESREVFFPSSRSELEALISQIDEDGIVAISGELNKQVTADAAASDREAVGNA